MQPFTITNRITKEEYSSAIRKKTLKTPLFKIIIIVGFLMLLVAMLETFDLIPMQDSSNPPLFQYFFGVFALAMPFFVKKQAAKTYDKQSRLHQEVIYIFDEKEIISKGINFSNSYSWDTIMKREEIGNLMFLYTGENVAEILTKASFSTEQLEYIRSKT